MPVSRLQARPDPSLWVHMTTCTASPREATLVVGVRAGPPACTSGVRTRGEDWQSENVGRVTVHWAPVLDVTWAFHVEY